MGYVWSELLLPKVIIINTCLPDILLQCHPSRNSLVEKILQRSLMFLHCPLTKETNDHNLYKMIYSKQPQKMKILSFFGAEGILLFVQDVGNNFSLCSKGHTSFFVPIMKITVIKFVVFSCDSQSLYALRLYRPCVFPVGLGTLGEPWQTYVPVLCPVMANKIFEGLPCLLLASRKLSG